MAAVNEYADSGYREFRSDNYEVEGSWPRLRVNYNRGPVVAGAYAGRAWPGGAKYINTLTPTFRASVLDQDGDASNVTFSVRRSDGTTVWTATSSAVPSQTVAEQSMPAGLLVDGQTYAVRVTASDGRRTSSIDSPVLRVATESHLDDATRLAATDVVDLSAPEPVADDGLLARSMWVNFQNGVAACMKVKGLTYAVNAFPADMDITTDPDAETGYGVTTAVTTSTGPAAAQVEFDNMSLPDKAAYVEALRGATYDGSDFDASAHDGVIESEHLGLATDTAGCERNARAIVAEPARAAWADMAPAAEELYQELTAEPAVQQAQAVWSGCMADAGHVFADPSDPSQTLMAEGQNTLTPTSSPSEITEFEETEQAVATQDVICRDAAPLTAAAQTDAWSEFVSVHSTELAKASGAAGAVS